MPQRTLLSLALLGGWPGAILAQVWSGRKTGRQPIGTLLTLTGVAQVLMAGAVGVTAMSDGVHPLLDINRLAAAFDGTAPPGAEKALPRRFGPGSADW